MTQAIIHTDSLQALTEKLKAILPGSAGYDGALRVAAAQTLQSVKQRIHADGLAADGSDIGTYSTKPIYISTITGTGAGLPQPMGKTGKQTFTTGNKKGQPHTSQYFANGYGGFKTILGLSEGGKVNLKLTGELCNQLTMLGNPGGGGFGLGWEDEQYSKLAEALETKYAKKIWALTEEERREATNVLTCECVNVLK